MSPNASLRVLVVDDEPSFRDLYRRVLLEAGFAVTEAANVDEAKAALADVSPAMVVSDVRMPGASGLSLLQDMRAAGVTIPVLLITAYADVRDAVTALRLGAVDYLAKPIDLDELVTAVRDALGVTKLDPALPAEALANVVAESAAMRSILRDAWRIAPSDVNVLITGESGTGKEVLADFIHTHSSRAKGPLVAVNCAALPEALLSSELFGHERGAFTGASQARKGKFREAQGGTLFLDEIGDMPLALQPALLRALEARVVTPLGASGDVAVDFRLVAATNSDLERDVAEGRFRADLYYRLNVLTLQLDPLRERREDILPLARRFLGQAAGISGNTSGNTSPTKRISRAAAELLTRYGWPGNVRELNNAMQRARLLARGDVVLPEDLPAAIRKSTDASSTTTTTTTTATTAASAASTMSGTTSATTAPAPADGRLPAHGRAVDDDDNDDNDNDAAPMQTLQEGQEAAVRRALEATNGNRTRAAELLGITRRGLLKKLKRLGIE